MTAAADAPGDAHALLAPLLAAGIAEVHAAAARVLASATAPARARVIAGAKPAARAKSPAPVKPPAPIRDEEAVHDFRVALRRLRTVLRPARRAYGKKRLRPTEGELRAHARASGALRDEEVLRETIASLELLPVWRRAVDLWLAKRRAQERVRRSKLAALVRGADDRSRPAAGTSAASPAQPPATARVPPIAETLRALEGHVAPRRRLPSAVALAHASLERARRGVDALREVDARDVRGLHALRIAFKRLRYTAELFAPFYGATGEAIARSAARMQKRLGEVHDLDEAVIRIARAKSLAPRARTAVIAALRKARAEKVTRALTELEAFERSASSTPGPSNPSGPA